MLMEDHLTSVAQKDELSLETLQESHEAEADEELEEAAAGVDLICAAGAGTATSKSTQCASGSRVVVLLKMETLTFTLAFSALKANSVQTREGAP